ncbi:MAG: DUF4332 domain-containing protein [Bacteroidales bacterium]
MINKIEEIEGIGVAIAEKFHAIGIKTTSDLLEKSKTPKCRHDLAAEAGLTEKQILKFANMADLFRIHGIAKEYSELLEVAGVDTVPELSHRVPDNLHKKLIEVNEAKHLTRRVPTLPEVEKWVAEAKALPRMLEY